MVNCTDENSSNCYQLKTTGDKKIIYQDIFAYYIYDYILVSETAMKAIMNCKINIFKEQGLSKAIKNIDALNVKIDWFDLTNGKTIGEKIVNLCQLHAFILTGTHDMFCTYADMNGKRKDINFDWFDIYQKMKNFYEQQKCCVLI